MADYVQLMSGLVIPEAAFAEAIGRPETREIATTRDGADITRGYVDSLPLLPSQDSVLQARGGDLKIYDEVLRDDQVAATFGQRRLAVVSREWDVQPGGNKRQDKAAAESLKEFLNGVNAGQVRLDAAAAPLSGFDAATAKMLFGVFYGFAVAECLWSRDGRHVVLDGLKVRKQRRFGWAPDHTLRLLTMAHPLGEPLPAKKFWTFSVGADNDDEPYGLGLAHWLYWPVFFKRQGMKLWLIFIDKFAAPTVVGEYPSNASTEERRKLLQAARAVATDAGLILPQGMSLKLLEASRSGNIDYRTLQDYMNGAISKVVLGHSGGADSTTGKLGGEDLAGEVRQDVIKADADLVCESFNRGPARWLTDWNYPGAAYPRVHRVIEDAEDLTRVATREKSIFDMGYRPTLRHIQDTYGGEWEPVTPAPPAPGGEFPPAPAPAPAFAEGDEVDEVDPTAPLTEQLAQQAADPLRGWLDQVRTFAEQAGSLEELRDRLLSAYGDLPSDELAGVMGIAFQVAELSGRVDVIEESGQ